MTSTDQLAAMLSDLRRRIDNLERPNRLDRSSITIDENGTTMDVRRAVLDSPSVPLRAAQEISIVTSASDVADGLSTVFYDTEIPAITPAAGDLWNPKGTVVLQWNGSWVELPETDLGVALSDYRSTLVPADNRIDIYWTTTAPGLALIGDMWFKTDASNLPHRWDGDRWVALLSVQAQSTNFTPGESGLGLQPDGNAQLQDVTVLGQASIPSISTDEIILGGTSLTETLGQSSIGKVLSARLPTQGASLNITTTPTKILELNCGTVQAGRTYRIVSQFLVGGSGTLAYNDVVTFTYRYTLDGSSPTTSSPIMDGGFGDNYVVNGYGNWAPAIASAEIDIATSTILKIGLVADQVRGGGAYTIYAGSSTHSRPVMTLYDDGPSGARQDGAISLTGGGTSRFVKTYNANWAYGVSTAEGFELINSYLYIGSVDDYCGYIGFDSTSIVAQLAGVTNPISCVARWKPRTRKTSTGLDVKLASHNLASSSAASTACGGLPSFAYANAAGYGLTLLSNVRSNAVPGTYYDESLGTTVFNQFKAGTRKGLAFLGVPEQSGSGGEGSIYGDGTYQMQLIFTYDGTF